MKLFIVVFLLPLAYGLPSKRLFLDSLGGSVFDLDTLKADLQIMIDVLGSDPTEAACENECHNLIQTGHVLNYGCPLVCHAFQSLVNAFKLTTPASTGSMGKRFFVDGSTVFDLDTLKADIQIMLDALGSEPTEQACEAECHKILQDGHVLNYGCPIVCRGFQSLVQTFKLTTPAAMQMATKM